MTPYKRKKATVFVVWIGALILTIGVFNSLIVESESQIEAVISMPTHIFQIGQNISGDLKIVNGRNQEIYLAGYPPFSVTVLDNRTSERVWSQDNAVILIALRIPIKEHSSYTIYHPCFSITTKSKTGSSRFSPGKYTVLIHYHLPISFNSSVTTIETFSATARTYFEVQ